MLTHSASSRTPLHTPGVRVVVVVDVVEVVDVVVETVLLLVVVVVPVTLVVVVVEHVPHMIGQTRLILSPMSGLVQNDTGMLHRSTGSSRGASWQENGVVVVTVVVVVAVVVVMEVPV